MNYTNLLYLVLWLFCYYFIMLYIPYGTNLLQNLPVIGTYWSSIPTETHWLLGILMYIIVPLVGIAYTIKSSSPEQQFIIEQ